MNILFIHPNFPAQFRHVAAALAADPANSVVFACTNVRPEWNIPGVRKVQFATKFTPPKESHRLARHFENVAAQGEAGYVMCRKLKEAGFVPDVIVGHSGWGATMFVRDAFPNVPFLAYFEWFYRADGADVGFDPSEPVGEVTRLGLRTKNMPIFADLESCSAGQVPTQWQREQFPSLFHSKLAVRHDGIDVNYFAPVAAEERGKLVLPDLDLSGADEIVTYATRGMEPYRGFPQFMRAVPRIMKERPWAHVVVVGEDRVCYGKPPQKGGSWKEVLLNELRTTDGFDETRLHFTGGLPYGQYKQVLQHSSAHIYLSRPFVLSWSMLEAMSCGALVVGSDTAPVREAIAHGENGLLVDFFSPVALAEQVCEALENQAGYESIRKAARDSIVETYNLHTLLPQHVAAITGLA